MTERPDSAYYWQTLLISESYEQSHGDGFALDHVQHCDELIELQREASGFSWQFIQWHLRIVNVDRTFSIANGLPRDVADIDAPADPVSIAPKAAGTWYDVRDEDVLRLDCGEADEVGRL